jgi:hypothetical protein
MGKGYYIVGAVLIGFGAFLLYNKIKSGNVNFNTRSQDDIVEAEDGSHLIPPMEVLPLAT